MGTYTQIKRDDLFIAAIAGYDIDCDYSLLREQINSRSFFDTFSDRMCRYISKREGRDFSRKDAYLFLYNKMKDAETDPTRTTIENWLNVYDSSKGVFGPDWGDENREAMFQIAFSLGLDVEETEDFFHRVYLDKAFNFRNLKEYVYYYSLLHKKSYIEARNLVAEASGLFPCDSNSAENSATKMIKSKALDAKSDLDFLTYIQEHSIIFTKKNETALAMLESKLIDLKGSDGETGLAEKEYRKYNDTKGSAGRNMHSVKFVLDMAVNGPESSVKSVKGQWTKRVREVFPRKEISNQFPSANNISRPDSSFKLRKDLIFIYFYWFWVKDLLMNSSQGDFSSFFDELNNVLETCGFGPLYYGNPYDWLFLYCSACKDQGGNPLDVFRGILEEDWEDEE